MSGTTWVPLRRTTRSRLPWLKPLWQSGFARQLGKTSLVRFLGIGLSFAFSVAVSRILGPDGRGVFAAATTMSAIGVQLGNLGLHSANTYFVARDRTLLPAALGNSLVVGLLFSSLVAGLVGAGFAWQPQLAPVQGWMCVLGLASIPLSLTRLFGQNLLIAVDQVGPYNRLELAGHVLNVALVATLLTFANVSPELLMASTLLMSALFVVWTLRLLSDFLPRAPRFSFTLLCNSTRYGLKAWAAALGSFLVIRSDVLMVKSAAGAEACGYYSIAAAGADFLMTVPILMGTLLFPRLAATENPLERWRIARRFALWTLPIMVVGGLVLFAASEQLIRWTYGADFTPAASAVRWLLPGLVALAANTILMNYLAASGMPLITVLAPFAALAVNIRLNRWWIPLRGIDGAAMSSTICYLLMLALTVGYIVCIDRRNRACSA